MLKVISSKTGKLTLAYNNMFLHSKYDPEKEADRFIKESLKDDNPSVVILLGAGIGYLSRELKKMSPYSKQILIYYSKEIYEHCNEIEVSQYSWHPRLGLSFSDFLQKHFSDIDLEGLKIIEWPPSSLIFPATSRKINLEIKRIVKEFRGNIVTTNAFGKIWIKNSFSNFISIDSIINGPICNPDNPVIITASGPMLENSIKYIQNYRHKINLWSLPSAIPFLVENNLKPDLLIITDSSYYSICHIQEIAEKNTLIAMPLSAARGIHSISNNIFLISQPFFYEELIIKKAGINPTMIPPKGTVAATALELALQFTNKEIIFCGLDLCYEDINAHVKTNFFNKLLRNDANRIKPYYSRIFSRAVRHAPIKNKKIRTSIPLDTYANWFSNIDTTIKKRIFRFMPSICNIRGVDNLDIPAFINLLLSYPDINLKSPVLLNKLYPDKLIRKNIILNIIDEWKKIIKTAELNTNKNINLNLSNSDFYNLAYFIDLPDLTSLKKHLRNNNIDKVNKFFMKLISKLNRFTESLYNKIKKVDIDA